MRGMLYRVFGEDAIGRSLPGTSTRLVPGYWTPRYWAALRLWLELRETAKWVLGAGTWAVIARVPREALVLAPPPHKGNVVPGWEWLDEGEVYAVGVDPDRVELWDPDDPRVPKWTPLREALPKCLPWLKMEEL
ncbi:MAG: hypothetical protein N2557_07980 [Hydrogenophilus sp.]|nr:hypothetical protein [Hydrogenophilus sp.]